MSGAARRAPRLFALLILGSCLPAEAAVLYRLQAQSTFVRGCFPPCDCPQQQAPIQGSFELELITVGDVFDFYTIPDVSWIVTRESRESTLTGSGSYQVSTIIGQHLMALDLALDEAPAEHYTSDVVPMSVPFPDIDIQLSIHGGVCLDTLIDVRSRPTPRLGVGRDDLAWDSGLELVGYDVVQGSLTVLRDTGGSFALATDACLADDLHATSMPFDAEPAVGDGFWFLVRASGSTYDTGLPSQVTVRDAGIAASSVACN
jgi:hypothetical protein